MKHTISVISPVYNVKPYLERFIHSIKNQTCLDGVEVILVDDASTDGTFEGPALLHLIQQTEQIRVIHNWAGPFLAAGVMLLISWAFWRFALSQYQSAGG